MRCKIICYLTQEVLSEKIIAELRETFDLIDRNGSGTISKKELATLFKGLGVLISSSELENMMKDADLNSDGEIDFQEFLVIMASQKREENDEDIKNVKSVLSEI